MVDYHELAQLPTDSVEDILARVRFTNTGPEIVIKGETQWDHGFSGRREQTLAQSLPHLITFIESPHAAEKLAACNKTTSHAQYARLRLYFNEIENTQIDLICQMIQTTRFSVPTLIVFGHNQLKDDAVQKLANVFQYGSPLLFIDLWDVSITKTGVDHIRDALMQAPLQKGFYFRVCHVARADARNILLELLEALLIAIDARLENAIPNVQEICGAINAYHALYHIVPDGDWDKINAQELLYLRYFLIKLGSLIKCPDARDASAELSALMTEYSDKTSELNFPQGYLWKSLLEGFGQAYAAIPEKPSQWPYVKQKLRLSQAPVIASPTSAEQALSLTL